MTTRYQITVDLPTAKEYVEVAGLGLFENGKTTLLTEEQVYLWFNHPRSGGTDPLSYFPEGIEVKEVPTSKPSGDENQTSNEPADAREGDV